ncbi:MAG: Co2+/Mg2+ efflux protein ApaG [Bacteroidota bacterium]
MVFSEITEGIRVTVQPIYLDGQSDFLVKKFVFAYFVRIDNLSHEPVKLLRRHWHIEHSTGKTENIDGEGIIGKQPQINPNKRHEYNSYCILESMEGSMEGYYLMERTDGSSFEVTIPRFPLRAAAN